MNEQLQTILDKLKDYKSNLVTIQGNVGAGSFITIAIRAKEGTQTYEMIRKELLDILGSYPVTKVRSGFLLKF